LFYITILQSLLAPTSLDVSAVLLCPLQAIRMSHIAGATYFLLTTNLPLGVSSSSPSLEARRLLPVHLSVGQAISCSVKVMRSLAAIYEDVLQTLYPLLVF